MPLSQRGARNTHYRRGFFAASTVAVRGPDNPIFDAVGDGGGFLSWLGIHDLDAVPWLVGEPVVEVMAMTGRVGHPGLQVEDVPSLALRFAGGAVFTLAHAYCLPARGYRSSPAFYPAAMTLISERL